MTPKVYGIYGSPPFGAVLMCADALKIKIDIEIVDVLGKAHLKEDFLQVIEQKSLIDKIPNDQESLINLLILID